MLWLEPIHVLGCLQFSSRTITGAVLISDQSRCADTLRCATIRTTQSLLHTGCHMYSILTVYGEHHVNCWHWDCYLPLQRWWEVIFSSASVCR